MSTHRDVKRAPAYLEDLEHVDERIRKLIRDVNTLSFIKQTTMSCAGYGPNDDGDDHVPRQGVYRGWFGVEFVDYMNADVVTYRSAHEFDRDVSAVSGDDVSARGENGRVYGLSARTETGLAKKWVMVQAIVDKFLRQGSKTRHRYRR